MASQATTQMQLPLGDRLGPVALPRPAGDAETAAASGAGARGLSWRRLPVRRPFLDAVQRHCELHETTASDLLAAVTHVFDPETLAGVRDPGSPLPRDVTVVWRPTRAGGLRRTRAVPRLRVRAPRTSSDDAVRRALALAIALRAGDVYDLVPRLTVEGWHEAWRQREADLVSERDHARESLERLAFKPLEGGIRTAAQAARVMGLISEFGLTSDHITRRFRQLAPVFHPDTGALADPERMRQLIEARRVLMDFARDGS